MKGYWGAALGGAAAIQYENLRRLADRLEKERPKTIPCSICGKPIPVQNITIRDAQVICHQCYEEKYALKSASKKRVPKK